MQYSQENTCVNILYSFLEDVYMRPGMKFTRQENLVLSWKKSLYINFHLRWNEIKFLFKGGRSKTGHQKISIRTRYWDKPVGDNNPGIFWKSFMLN